jgi:6-phosphogluconolactonase
MSIKIRALLMLGAAAALLAMSACGGGYTCNITFGASTCNQSGSGIGTNGGGGGNGGGGTGQATAFAYAVDQAGTLDSFTLNATAGTFAATANYTAPVIPTADPGAGMVVAQKQFVYTVFDTDGSIFGWSLDSSSGSLTALSGFPMTLPSLLPNVAFNQYNLATNPTGTLLFLSSTGSDEIFVYQIGTSGTLTAVTGSPFVTPVEPGNVTTDGLGNYLYVCENVNGHTGLEVLAYAISSSGALTAIPGSPFAFPMWQLQGDASGKYLIGTSGNTQSLTGSDDKNLYVFSIQQTGSNAGALTAVTGSPFATVYSPFNIAAQPPASKSEFVYSFSINDTDTGYNPVEGYSLDTTSGALTLVTGSPFSNVASGHWGQFDQIGAYLIVYSSVNNGSGTMTQLGPLTVGTDGSLTQPISSATLATPGYWVVTDP